MYFIVFYSRTPPVFSILGPVPTLFSRGGVSGARLAPRPPTTQPDLSHGVSMNLWNNLWQTNYVFWYPFDMDDASFLSGSLTS